MDLPFKPDLSSKTAVVTGGAGVLCSEFCSALAECGAKVAILGRTLSKCEALAEEIKAAGGEAMGVCADVTDRAAVEEAHKKVLDAYGKCDILINGAGGNKPGATSDDEFFSMDTLNDPGKKVHPDTGICTRHGRGRMRLYHKYKLDERVYSAYQDTGIQRGQVGC